jgi:hypothetical protein
MKGLDSYQARFVILLGRFADCRKIPITLTDFGRNQDSDCKLLENRLRAARHQQKSSKIVL